MFTTASARRVTGVLCWLMAAAAPALGAAWYMSYVGGLDADDPLYSESAAWAVVLIGGGTFAATAVLAGVALLLADERLLRRGYLWALAVTLPVGSVTAWYVLGSGTALVFTALSAGPFVLLWSTADERRERRLALCGLAFSSGMAAAIVAQLVTS